MSNVEKPIVFPLIVLGSIGGIWLLMRRRTTPIEQSSTPPAQVPSDKRYTILLDPAHDRGERGAMYVGGSYFNPVLGTRRYENAVDEDVVTWAVALAVANKLKEAPNITVYLTRNADTRLDVASRRNMICQLKPNVFVSIHVGNAPLEKQVKPLGNCPYMADRVLALVQDAESRPLAEEIAKRLASARRVPYNIQTSSTGDAAVLNPACARGACIDMGLMCKEEFRGPLDDQELSAATKSAYINKLAYPIAEGILAYLGILKPPSPVRT